MSGDWKPTRKADPRCSCVDGRYECGWCESLAMLQAERRLTDAQRRYDLHFTTRTAHGGPDE